MMNMSTMWIVTFVGIIVILFLLVASTAFRCLSSNTLASVLQIGAIVIFIVLFAFLMLFFLSNASDHHENLDDFTKKAKARAKSNYMKMLLSTTTHPPLFNSNPYFPHPNGTAYGWSTPPPPPPYPRSSNSG